MVKNAYLVLGTWRPIYSEGKGVTSGNRGDIFVARFEDFTAHPLVSESIFTGMQMRGVNLAHLVATKWGATRS